VEESLKAGSGQILNVAEGIQVLNLRGAMIPVIRLSEVFGTGGGGDIATIVENVNGETYAVMSDEILSKREVVIKSLGAYFRNLKGISSGTVLAGGKIGYVLDIEQVVELGRNSAGSGR
jgi:two-component system, chemotaxis family, sensor kinase CheA